MTNLPDSLEQLERRFATEQACSELLRFLRWPKGFRCPRCGSPQAWWTAERGLFRCCRCDKQTSVTAGTIFQGTRKPLRAWFSAMWRVASEPHGVSALEIQQILGLGSYHTAWAWLHKLRFAMAGTIGAVLTGTVAAGEGRVGAAWRQGRSGGPDERPLIFAAVQDNAGRPGRVRLRSIPDRSAASVQAAIRSTVALGTLLYTDDRAAYEGLRLYGYRHRAVSARAAGGSGETLPLVRQALDMLDEWLLHTHRGGVQPVHLDYYLDEFSFRMSQRGLRSRGKVFFELLQGALQAAPAEAKAIRGHSAAVRRGEAGESESHSLAFPLPTVIVPKFGILR